MRTLYSTLPSPATPYPKILSLKTSKTPKEGSVGGQNQLWLAHTGKEMRPEAESGTKPQWSLCWVSRRDRGKAGPCKEEERKRMMRDLFLIPFDMLGEQGSWPWVNKENQEGMLSLTLQLVSPGQGGGTWAAGWGRALWRCSCCTRSTDRYTTLVAMPAASAFCSSMKTPLHLSCGLQYKIKQCHHSPV